MEKFNSLNSAIASLFGEGTRILRRDRVHGGDINNAWRVEVGCHLESKNCHQDESLCHLERSREVYNAPANTQTIFIKTNSIENETFFKCESLALDCLRKTGAVGVPEVLAWGTDAGGGAESDSSILFSIKPFSFLILPYLESVPRSSGYWETFGHELAQMHRADTKDFCSKKFGFLEDNYIGFTPQKNTPSDSWVEFFRCSRLEPQFKKAWNYLEGGERNLANYLMENLGAYMPEPEFPSLLHGDLWSGNVYGGPDGKAWILDPASYVGSFEADLAMTSLFGGFPGRFYNAYDEVNRISPDFVKRTDLYNLYHLLNHLNMFGPGYLADVQQILREYK